MKKIGIFGGGFDPIHLGHLILAEQCREQLALDRVLFIPCATGPFKPDGPVAGDRDRAEMIRLAIGGHPAFALSTLELDRGGVSYTVDTLEQLKQQHPEDELYLLMGADSLGGFPQWKNPDRICQIATPVIVRRPGAEEIDLEQSIRPIVSVERLEEIRRHQIVSRLIEISSTEIRKRRAEDKSIRYLTPRAVEKYIETKRLYRTAPQPE